MHMPSERWPVPAAEGGGPTESHAARPPNNYIRPTLHSSTGQACVLPSLRGDVSPRNTAHTPPRPPVRSSGIVVAAAYGISHRQLKARVTSNDPASPPPALFGMRVLQLDGVSSCASRTPMPTYTATMTRFDPSRTQPRSAPHRPAPPLSPRARMRSMRRGSSLALDQAYTAGGR